MRTENEGLPSDLLKSNVILHLGRFAAWPKGDPNICTPSEELFNQYKEALKGYGPYEFHAQNYHCVYWKQPREQHWDLQPWAGSIGTYPYPVGSGAVCGGDSGVACERRFDLLARLDVNPSAKINALLLLDVSLDVTIRYDECSTVGGCDEYTTTSTSPPAIVPVYFDILPSRLFGLWNWSELTNLDPDGDGLWGHPPTCWSRRQPLPG